MSVSPSQPIYCQSFTVSQTWRETVSRLLVAGWGSVELWLWKRKNTLPVQGFLSVFSSLEESEDGSLGVQDPSDTAEQNSTQVCDEMKSLTQKSGVCNGLKSPEIF